MKTVAANVGATEEFSAGVLIGSVESQTRWGLGSLMAGVLARSVVPLVLCLVPGAQGHMTLTAWENIGAFDDEVNEIVVPSTTFDLVIARGGGTSKSRPVIIEIPESVTVESAVLKIDTEEVPAGTMKNDLMIALTTNSNPSFSLLGIINKLESYLDSLTGDWALFIDQDVEKIYLIGDNAGARTTLMAVANNELPVASFDLVADVTTEAVPGFGWE